MLPVLKYNSSSPKFQLEKRPQITRYDNFGIVIIDISLKFQHVSVNVC